MENLYELQFCRFHDENIVHLGLKFVLNKNQCGCLTTFVIVRLAPLEGTVSSTLMLSYIISLKLIVGTYMDGTTLVDNGKNILGVPFLRIPP